ncbi:MAG: hypothetical protein GX202_01935 [Firmicutes bacterium]|nr:hypothetical protein [Bacillota bacterium]
MPFLCGGSVNSQHATGLMEQPAIDGLFIGRTAWETESFAALLDKLLNCAKRSQWWLIKVDEGE